VRAFLYLSFSRRAGRFEFLLSLSHLALSHLALPRSLRVQPWRTSAEFEFPDADFLSFFWCAADEILAALDGTYCSVSPVGSEGITDCGDKPATNVISISYHFNPDLTDPTISPVVQRQCTEIGKVYCPS
jgi:hypothetical protein